MASVSDITSPLTPIESLHDPVLEVMYKALSQLKIAFMCDYEINVVLSSTAVKAANTGFESLNIETEEQRTQAELTYKAGFYLVLDIGAVAQRTYPISTFAESLRGGVNLIDVHDFARWVISMDSRSAIDHEDHKKLFMPIPSTSVDLDDLPELEVEEELSMGDIDAMYAMLKRIGHDCVGVGNTTKEMSDAGRQFYTLLLHAVGQEVLHRTTANPVPSLGHMNHLCQELMRELENGTKPLKRYRRRRTYALDRSKPYAFERSICKKPIKCKRVHARACYAVAPSECVLRKPCISALD